MARFSMIWGFAAALLALTTIGTATQAQSSSMRDRAVARLQALLDTPANSRLMQGMRQNVQKAHDDNRNVAFTIGPEMSKNGKSYMVYLWDGDMFVFQLSEAEFRGLNTRADVVTTTTSRKSAERGQSVLINLERPKLNANGRIENDSPLTGKIAIQVHEKPALKVAWRVSYQVPGTVSSTVITKPINELPEENGTLDLNLVLTPEADGKAYKGPLPIFLQLCTIEGSGAEQTVTIISNTIPLLVDVR